MEKKLYILTSHALFNTTLLRLNLFDLKNIAKRLTGTAVTKKVPMVILA